MNKKWHFNLSLLLRSGPCILSFYVSGKMKRWKNRTESAGNSQCFPWIRIKRIIYQSGGCIIAFFSVHIEGVWDEIGWMVCFTMHENGIRWKLRTLVEETSEPLWNAEMKTITSLDWPFAFLLLFLRLLSQFCSFISPFFRINGMSFYQINQPCGLNSLLGLLQYVSCWLWIPGKDTGALDPTQDKWYSDAQITPAQTNRICPPPSHLHF